MLIVGIYSDYVEVIGYFNLTNNFLQGLKDNFDLKGIEYYCKTHVDKYSHEVAATWRFKGNKARLYDLLNYITDYTYDYEIR